MTLILSFFGGGNLDSLNPFRFTGSIWACALQGWGNLACMYCCNSISREFFFATTFGLLLWLGFTFGRDTDAYGHSSPMDSLKELIFGK